VGLAKFAWMCAMLGRIDRLGQMDSSFCWGEFIVRSCAVLCWVNSRGRQRDGSLSGERSEREGELEIDRRRWIVLIDFELCMV
jgi:hypothetical protein